MLLLHDILHEHVLQHYMFHPSQTSFGCPCLRRLTVDMVHECHFVSQFFPEMFRHPSLRKFQLSVSLRSASAERKLTDCRVLVHVLLHCLTAPLVLLHVWCCPAQPLSVYTFTNGRNLLISIKHFALGTPFKCHAIRFTFISSLSVGHVIFLAVSFTVHDVSTLLAHVQQFSHGCPVHGSFLVLQFDQ